MKAQSASLALCPQPRSPEATRVARRQRVTWGERGRMGRMRFWPRSWPNATVLLVSARPTAATPGRLPPPGDGGEDRGRARAVGATRPRVAGAARQDDPGHAAEAALPVALRGAPLSRSTRARSAGRATLEVMPDVMLARRRARRAGGGGSRLGRRAPARRRAPKGRRRDGRFTCGRSGARCFWHTATPRPSPH